MKWWMPHDLEKPKDWDPKKQLENIPEEFK
jgi:hypothetical protein